MLDKDVQGDGAARHGGEAVMDGAQIAGYQGEKIGRLGEGIVPDREVTPAIAWARLDAVAVGKQHRILLAVGLDAHREDGKIVRPVDEICDAAEAFRLALGAEHPAGLVKPF